MSVEIDKPEKGCRWHFAPQEGGREDGPNDAMMQNFKQKPYQALVREAVQNSLDAVRSLAEPVRVEITFGSLGVNNFPNFFNLEEHIRECSQYYHWNEKAVAMYGQMSRIFQSGQLKKKLDYIKVADYNTKGMEYKPGSTQSPFYAFARAAGVSSKIDQQSGGSFGFGKSAYFQLSEIGTVFISSQTPELPHKPARVAFEGVSWLCTHTHDGQKVSSVGYYDNNDGLPISEEENIPARFSRKGEPGTSFYILGFQPYLRQQAAEEMIEEALRSFWMAILSNHLVIKIGDIEINRENLEELMLQYIPDEADNTAKRGYYKPLPYLRAVKLADISQKAKRFTETLPLLGECSLYLMKHKEARDKIAYMRRPLMLVYAKRTQTSYGVFGVFVCENTKGDSILRNMENPAHDEWKQGNWRDENNRIVAKGADALNEIQEFIQRCFSRLFASAQDTALEITGLDELLYIPEDLLGDPEEKADHQFGTPTGDTKEEGLSLTSDLSEKNVSQRDKEDDANIGSVRVTLPGSAEDYEPEPDDPDSELIGIGGHRRKKSRTKGGKPTGGNDWKERKIENPDGTYKVFLPVEFRVVAQKENDKYYHNIIIHSPRDVIEGEIELVTIGEQTDDIVNLSWTDNGNIRDNSLTGVILEEGKNTIKILFEDNMRHALKLKAYENK